MSNKDDPQSMEVDTPVAVQVIDSKQQQLQQQQQQQQQKFKETVHK
jgi:hypothetical protein